MGGSLWDGCSLGLPPESRRFESSVRDPPLSRLRFLESSSWFFFLDLLAISRS
uniref:Uncharacterized protein n=1 Tax=Anguilla anguilla TaxID=7936 RepID=A0A0E9TWL4_ANGAN